MSEAVGGKSLLGGVEENGGGGGGCDSRLTSFYTFSKMRALTIHYTAFWAAERDARIETAKFSKFQGAHPVQSFKQFSKLAKFGKFLQN